MDDKRQVLMSSDAGGTGYLSRAGLTRKNQSRRIHCLAQPEWRANKAVQGFVLAGIGLVDFEWGDSKKGIAHIIVQRMARDGVTQAQVERFLGTGVMETIARRCVEKQTSVSGRVRTTANAVNATVLVKTPKSNAWFVTGFKVWPTGGQGGLFGPTQPTQAAPTLTRHGLGADGSDIVDKKDGPLFSGRAARRSRAGRQRRAPDRPDRPAALRRHGQDEQHHLQGTAPEQRGGIGEAMAQSLPIELLVRQMTHSHRSSGWTPVAARQAGSGNQELVAVDAGTLALSHFAFFLNGCLARPFCEVECALAVLNLGTIVPRFQVGALALLGLGKSGAIAPLFRQSSAALLHLPAQMTTPAFGTNSPPCRMKQRSSRLSIKRKIMGGTRTSLIQAIKPRKNSPEVGDHALKRLPICMTYS